METRYSKFPVECFLGSTFQSERFQCLDRICFFVGSRCKSKDLITSLTKCVPQPAFVKRSSPDVLLVSLLARAMGKVVHIPPLITRPTSTTRSGAGTEES